MVGILYKHSVAIIFRIVLSGDSENLRLFWVLLKIVKHCDIVQTVAL